MKILAVSDEVVERLYSLCSSGHFSDVELILGCGDLPYPYLENLLTFLNIPLLYVPGNHDPIYNPDNHLAHVEGGSNLDLKLTRYKRFLIGGFGRLHPLPAGWHEPIYADRSLPSEHFACCHVCY